MRNSIIRRSFGFGSIFLLGHAFSYAMLVIAEGLLDKGGFGVFYLAWATMNILTAPAMASMLIIGRYFGEVAARRGTSAVTNITRILLDRYAVRLALVVTWLGLIGGLVLRSLEISAWPLAILIPMTSFALIICELLRTCCQSMFRFSMSGVLWLASTISQFVLMTIGLLLTTKVWAGVAGILLGASGTATFFSWLLLRSSNRSTSANYELPLNWRDHSPVIFANSLFTVLCNLDILVGYWLLPQPAFDTYAVAAILPKTIVVASLPIAQITMNVVLAMRSRDESVWLPVAKSLLFVPATLAIAVLLIMLAPLLREIPVTALHFDTSIASTLFGAAAAIGGIRILIAAEFALRSHVIVYAQFVIVPAIGIVCGISVTSVADLAEVYFFSACAFFILACVYLAWLLLLNRPSNMASIKG